MNAITTDTSRYGRWQSAGVWAMRIVLAAAFAAAGTAKLAGAAMMVANFDQIGLGQWFRYVAGVTETGIAILLLVPATGFVGALMALCVCAGAFVAQIGPLHGDVIHVLILGAFVALAAWLLRPAT